MFVPVPVIFTHGHFTGSMVGGAMQAMAVLPLAANGQGGHL